MFKKNLRLPISDFKKKKSKGLNTDFFSIKFSGNDLGFNRFGVIISSKAEPKSARRHLIKRKILAVAKEIPNQSVDFLVIALPKVKNLANKNISQAVLDLFSKIKS